MKKLHILLVLIVSLSSCVNRKLEYALYVSGDNRKELEKVLTHFKQDRENPLKYKAAVFLIENMPGLYYYDGTGNYEKYIKDMDSLLESRPSIEDFYLGIEQLQELHGTINHIVKQDITTIGSQYLIRNINRAFEVWETSPYAQHLDFEDFCDFILPHRISNEYPENWRDSVFRHFNGVLDWLDYDDEYRGSALAGTFFLNDTLKKFMNPTDWRTPGPVVNRLSLMYRKPVNDCSECAQVTTALARSFGIPVTMDYTPQWPHRNFGHSWNVVKDNQGDYIQFSGAHSNPGELHMPYDKKVKIYRYSYRINDELFQAIKKESMPVLLNNIHQIDVTAHYIEASAITVPIRKELKQSKKYGYLCVFDNKNWQAIQYGEIKRNKVTFKDMGKGVVYLPAYYVDRDLQPINYPFLYDKSKQQHFFVPDTTHRQDLVLYRKHPAFYHIYERYKMIGGRIEASHNSNFSDAVIIGTIDSVQFGYISIPVDPSAKYRYWRYVSAPEAHGNIAEMMFFSEGRMLDPNGKVLGTDGSEADKPTYTKEVVFDGDPLTYFHPEEPNPWVGMDFGVPVGLDNIVIMHCNDDNFIRLGDRYELFYWDKSGWISLGSTIADDFVLNYRDVPSNALYVLRNLTRGKDERIFSYQNGKQIWW